MFEPYTKEAAVDMCKPVFDADSLNPVPVARFESTYCLELDVTGSSILGALFCKASCLIEC